MNVSIFLLLQRIHSIQPDCNHNGATTSDPTTFVQILKIMLFRRIKCTSQSHKTFFTSIYSFFFVSQIFPQQATTIACIYKRTQLTKSISKFTPIFYEIDPNFVGLLLQKKKLSCNIHKSQYADAVTKSLTTKF